MSQPNEGIQVHDRTMCERVTVPAYFAKLAAIGAPSPTNEDEKNLWCRQGDLVTAVVKVSYDRLYSGRTTFKEAAESLGLATPDSTVKTSADAAEYLKNKDVWAAAEALVQGA